MEFIFIGALYGIIGALVATLILKDSEAPIVARVNFSLLWPLFILYIIIALIKAMIQGLKEL